MNLTNQTLSLNAPNPEAHGLGFKVALTTIYVMTFIVGFLGNSIGMYVVCRRTCISNVTNIFIANMSLADLLITLLAVPTSVVQLYIHKQWIGGFIGTVTCKLTFFSLYMSLAASVFTIVLISVERYAAIFYPLRGDDVKKPKIITSLIWIMSLGFASPMLVIPSVHNLNNKHQCIARWPDPSKTDQVIKIYLTLCFVVMYIAPVSFLCVLYSRVAFKLCSSTEDTPDKHSKRVRNSRKRVVRMLVGIVFVFSVCWLPAHIMHYLMTYKREAFSLVPNAVVFLSFWLCQANSSINPCLYIILNERFRQDFGKTIVNFIRACKNCCSFESSSSCLRRRRLRKYRSAQTSPRHSTHRRLSFMGLLQVFRGTFTNSPSGRMTAETKLNTRSLSAFQAKPAAETRF